MILFAIAVAVLGFALFGPIERAIKAGFGPRSPAEVLQERVRKEVEALRAEFAANRAAIVERVRALQNAGDHAAAMNAAARYYPLQDPELMALYRTSAEAEAARQRLADFRNLLQRECTEGTARTSAAAYLDSIAPSAPRSGISTPGDYRLTRLTAADARDQLARKLAETPPAAPAHADEHGPDHKDKGPHPARIPPDLAATFLRSAPADDDLVCVWKVQGQRNAGGARRRFELVLWLVPHGSAKMLESEALSFTER